MPYPENVGLDWPPEVCLNIVIVVLLLDFVHLTFNLNLRIRGHFLNDRVQSKMMFLF